MSFDDINEATLRLRRGEKWNQYAPDVLPAWVADMDFAVADPIRAALEDAIARGDLGYPVGHRKTGLPELFAERVASRFQWSVNARDVAVINDVVQGLYIGLMTLCEAGEGVVIQTPIYPPFLRAADDLGRVIVRNPLVAGTGGYSIDFAQLEAAITPTTRVLAFCNPHNPTGRAFSRAELERLAALCCRNDLWVISDEIHADLVLDGAAHIPLASLDADIAARTVTLMSASKAFNIAGLCMAFAHFGSRALRERFEQVNPRVRGGSGALSIAAVRAAWTESQDWQDEVVATLGRNRDRVAGFVAERWPGVVHHPPQATYLAWLDMNRLGLEPGPQQYLLEHARVALSDGSAFGTEGDGFVRLNFATSPALLDTILARLDAALTDKA